MVLLRGDAEAVGRAWPIVDAALRRCPDFGLVIEVPTYGLAAVRRRYSHETVVPPGGGSSFRVALTLSAQEPGTPDEICERLSASGHSWERRFRRPSIAELDAPGGQRISTLDELKAKLGENDEILCLGNGPSSEDPALGAHADATLFRVNWTWLDRGQLCDPQMVFTADPDLPPVGARAILALPTAFSGLPILLRHSAAGRPPDAGYLFLDQLAPPLADFDAAIIPTNGALMVAIAAALQPPRLILAGMDLYRHPAGRYPGQDAIDGYAREHSAECDLNLIRASLRGFRGKATILSPNLRAALAD